MKKTVLILLFSVLTAGTFAANNFDNHQRKPRKAKTALKAHVCTAACAGGKHVYAHGEKGHVCGPECMKAKM